MTIARQTLTTPRLLGQFSKEERPPNLMTIDSHIVQPYRFEPYLALPGGVDSAIAADDAN